MPIPKEWALNVPGSGIAVEHSGIRSRFFVISVQHVRAENRRKGSPNRQRKNCPIAIDTVSEKVYIVVTDTVSTLRRRGTFGGKINDKRNT